MVWEKKDSWAARYALAEEYYRQHGDLKVPRDSVVQGVWLNKWISEQRKKYRTGQLSMEKIQALSLLKMDWEGKARSGRSRKNGESLSAEVAL